MAAAVEQSGGLVWAIDGLEPEGSGTMLCVLYEVLSKTPVRAIPLDHPTADELVDWLQPYRALPFPVLATLSDGEEAIIAALGRCWPQARPPRYQSHWLSNVADLALTVDTQLREQMRADLGGPPAVPEQVEALAVADSVELPTLPPPFCRSPGMSN